MWDSEVVSVLVQAGAVGIAIAALMLTGYALRLVVNHLAHISELLGRISHAQEQHTKAIYLMLKALLRLTNHM